MASVLNRSGVSRAVAGFVVLRRPCRLRRSHRGSNPTSAKTRPSSWLLHVAGDRRHRRGKLRRISGSTFEGGKIARVQSATASQCLSAQGEDLGSQRQDPSFPGLVGMHEHLFLYGGRRRRQGRLAVLDRDDRQADRGLYLAGGVYPRREPPAAWSRTRICP